MIEAEKHIKRFGLVGKRLDYSFSKTYFEQEYNILYTQPARYDNYELPTADLIVPLTKEQRIDGLNVTIPFKESVMPFLDSVSNEAKAIGAVNTLKIKHLPGKLYVKGYNTDALGFETCVKHCLPNHNNALVLGTGGAAKAVAYVLQKHGIAVTFASRTKKAGNIIGYHSLNPDNIAAHTIIVNATPCGTVGFGADVQIPYNSITARHLCLDLVYNPAETLFIKECKKQGAITMNGLEMLYRQAEKSWEIWNS